MRRFRNTIIGVAAATIALAFWPAQAGAQFSGYQVPRTKDGRPDLSGIWQALNTANWDRYAHAAQAGHVVALGAEGAEPTAIGVVEGGEIPYLPAALAQKKANYEKRFTDDPEIKCYMPGVPRAPTCRFLFKFCKARKRSKFPMNSRPARGRFSSRRCRPRRSIPGWDSVVPRLSWPLGRRHSGS